MNAYDNRVKISSREQDRLNTLRGAMLSAVYFVLDVTGIHGNVRESDSVKC